MFHIIFACAALASLCLSNLPSPTATTITTAESRTFLTYHECLQYIASIRPVLHPNIEPTCTNAAPGDLEQ